MDGKKDPGKFTVRFNVADPQQRTAAMLLNRQGRCKAQFITNAVLFYIHTFQDGQVSFQSDNAMTQRIIMDADLKHPETSLTEGSDQNQDDLFASSSDANFEDTDMDTIQKTMKAFQSSNGS